MAILSCAAIGDVPLPSGSRCDTVDGPDRNIVEAESKLCALSEGKTVEQFTEERLFYALGGCETDRASGYFSVTVR